MQNTEPITIMGVEESTGQPTTPVTIMGIAEGVELVGHASTDKAGTVKLPQSIIIEDDGTIYAKDFDVEEFERRGNNAFVSKGTLLNYINRPFKLIYEGGKGFETVDISKYNEIKIIYSATVVGGTVYSITLANDDNTIIKTLSTINLSGNSLNARCDIDYYGLYTARYVGASGNTGSVINLNIFNDLTERLTKLNYAGLTGEASCKIYAR